MEPGDRTGIVVPPPAITALGLIAGIVLDTAVPIGTIPLPFPLRLGLLAVLGLAGIGLAASALFAFARARTTPNPYGGTSFLVPDGPYRRTRNPMYVGMLVAYLGVAFAWGGLWPLLLWPAVWAALHWHVVRREEAYLEARFGDAYRAYRARVRRWL